MILNTLQVNIYIYNKNNLHHFSIFYNISKILTKIQAEYCIALLITPKFPSSSVVENFTEPINIDTSQITNKRNHAETTCHMYSITSRKHVSPHMDIIKKYISGQGFSKETSSCIAAPIRSSISAIYDSKWSIFSFFCITKGR